MFRQSKAWTKRRAAWPQSSARCGSRTICRDRLGQFLRRLRRHEQAGPSGLDEIGKARQLRGDHRPAGGKALHHHHAKGLPGSRRNDRAKAVLQQPHFLRARRLADEMDLPPQDRAVRPGLPAPGLPVRARHDQVEIALAAQQGHRLQQHVDPFPRIEPAQEEQIGFRSGSMRRYPRAAAPARRIAQPRRRWESARSAAAPDRLRETSRPCNSLMATAASACSRARR